MGFPASRMAIRSPKGEMTLPSAESLEQVGGSAQSNVQEEHIERFGEKYKLLIFCYCITVWCLSYLSAGVLPSSSTLTFVPSPTCSTLMWSYRLLLLPHIATFFWTYPYSSEHLLPMDPFLTDSQPLHQLWQRDSRAYIIDIDIEYRYRNLSNSWV